MSDSKVQRKIAQIQELKKKIDRGEFPEPTPEQAARARDLLEKMEEVKLKQHSLSKDEKSASASSSSAQPKKKNKQPKADPVPQAAPNPDAPANGRAVLPNAPGPSLPAAMSVEEHVEKLFAAHPLLKQIRNIKTQYDEVQKLKQSIVFGRVEPTEELMRRVADAPQLKQKAAELELRWQTEKTEKVAFLKKVRVASQVACVATLAAVAVAASAERARLEEQRRVGTEERGDRKSGVLGKRVN
eukprot:RCo040125